MNAAAATSVCVVLAGLLMSAGAYALSCQNLGLDALRAELRHASFEAPVASLKTAFGEALARHADDFTTPAVYALLSDPFAAGPQAWQLPMLHSGVPVLAQIDALRRSAGWSNPQPAPTAMPAGAADFDVPRGIERLMILLAQLDVVLAEAFRDISPIDRQRILESLPALLDRVSNGQDLKDSGLSEPVMRVARTIDNAALRRALDLLLGIVGAEHTTTLLGQLIKIAPVARPEWLSASFRGAFLHAQQTPLGLILLGRPGRNTYGAPARLVVDLGGDDLHAAAATLVVDLGGNDRYVASQDGAAGAGLFGAGMILDAAGDDIYAGGRIAQGAGLFGVGVLWDRAGDDVYAAQELAQGAAIFGAGLLVDLEGNDHFAGAKFAQGFGGPDSLGILLDAAGHDRYIAGGKHASSYGTPGHYQAFSQGVGMGFRGDVSGGMGVLFDGSGDDRYIGGNFSQGAGYYLGLGLLIDASGNDAYTGSRYAQGAAAHLAAGVLVDAKGDDRYQAKTAANQGAAWDLAVAALLDCAGDDYYSGGELALGAGEQNGVGWFFDGRGSEHYAGRAKAFGHSGQTTYAGGRGAGNVAVFLDAGGDTDQYPPDGAPRNDGRSLQGNLGLFVDR